MRNIRKLVLGMGFLAGSVGAALAQSAPPPAPFILSSTSFQDGGVIPDKYTQASPSPVSPQLSWINTPAGTVSFVLIMHDPDTALNKSTTDVLHWMAFNIPGTLMELPEGVATMPQLPDGTIQPNNRGGHPGFMGPGSRGVYHHYTVELFALDTKLELGPDATRDQVLSAMNGHILGKAVVEGRFRR